MTKIACLSDCHGFWPVLDYPEADILIMAGDILDNYTSDRLDAAEQFQELSDLDNFVVGLPYKSVIYVSGNHEYCTSLRNEHRLSQVLKNIVYLRDASIILHGLKFYGSPWQPFFHDWNFNFPNPKDNPARAMAHAEECWAKIPTDTEVLITHGPAYGLRDRVMDGMAMGRDPHVGCPHLRERLNYLPNLKLHTVAHIHNSYGQERLQLPNASPLVVNAAACNEEYKPVNPIQVVEV